MTLLAYLASLRIGRSGEFFLRIQRMKIGTAETLADFRHRGIRIRITLEIGPTPTPGYFAEGRVRAVWRMGGRPYRKRGRFLFEEFPAEPIWIDWKQGVSRSLQELAKHEIDHQDTRQGISPEYRCSDCKGSGTYTGFHMVDDCRRCQGFGQSLAYSAKELCENPGPTPGSPEDLATRPSLPNPPLP